jgi:flagellar biosynthesis regulator FlaF
MLWLAMLWSAWGQEGPRTTVDEQIVVLDASEEQRRREAVIGRLLALGYTMGKHHGGDTDGYTEFRPPHDPKLKSDRWIPALRMFDEGFVVLGKGSQNDGAVVRKRDAVVEAIEPQMRSWRTAIQANALQHRLWVELPTELDAIWNDLAVAPEVRRAKLISFWVSRTCTPEGAAVRDAIRTYILEVVQSSEWPVTEAEAAAVSKDNECEVVLDLRE